MAESVPRTQRAILKRLLCPRWTDAVLRMLGELGRNFEPLFRNTANATIVRGGDKANVIPSEIILGLDGRLLPGQHPGDLIRELDALTQRTLDCRVRLYEPSSERIDPGLLPVLAAALRCQDTDARIAPYLLPGSSDARFFSRLGIQTYGFTPMNLPPDFSFFETIHAADERIPVECLAFGTRAMLEVLQTFGQTDLD